jgi:hypothetical protein
MNDFLFIPLIGILGLVSTIITSKGSLYDRRCKGLKYFTKRGWIVIFIGLVIISLSIWQYKFARKLENKTKEIKLNEEKLRDSVIASEITKGVDFNRRVLFHDLSEALSKQGLKLDTVNKRIASIKSYLPPPTIIVDSFEERPLLILDYKAISRIETKDSIEFKVIVSCEQAGGILLRKNIFV